jgi:hypothetical protein
MIAFLALAATGQTQAAERARAEVSCTPAGKPLVVDCTVVLLDTRTRQPIEGASLVIAADMPSMPMMHHVRPILGEATGRPGVYRARLVLEMPGQWAIKVTLSSPFRDQMVALVNVDG